MYVYQRKGWPEFTWDTRPFADVLTRVRHLQGRMLGRMEAMGFPLSAEASLQTITQDVLKSTEIEGELLNKEQVRSSVARRLGIEIAGLVPADRHVEGVVEMMLDATQNYTKPLTKTRLLSWQSSLFPTGTSGMFKINVGKWRDAKGGPMQLVSGVMGREQVHFEAPPAEVLNKEMMAFLKWFNQQDVKIDPILKAAVAHLWFVTIHPFDDGNGRIARAIADMQLARADGTSQRFYSMSAQIRVERNNYYKLLEETQKGDLDITEWLHWFLSCLHRSLQATDEMLAAILFKARFWRTHATTLLNARQQLLLNKLLDGFTGKLTSSKWAKIAKCSQDTAGRDIQDLVTKQVLVKEPGGGRSTSYTLAGL